MIYSPCEAEILPKDRAIGHGASSLKIGNRRLSLKTARVMGILNVTPDSFSGDGLNENVRMAVAQGKKMFAERADIVDIGGESTRPGAREIPEELELKRTIPVIKTLSRLHPGRISIDTCKPAVAEEAIRAGASIVNDVTGLRNPKMTLVVADHGASVVIMHMKGEPKTMQNRPRYRDVVEEIIGFMEQRISEAERIGIDSRAIMVDPGIGFGKTMNHNLEIIARLREFRVLGKPIVIGVSRKSFIGKITGRPVDQRLEGSIAAAVLAVNHGADIVRVHDVPETVRALEVNEAIQGKMRSATRR
jgi:dihydropteroate synthase